MTNKITLNDLKMAENLLEENCVKIVEIFFRLNINGNMIKTLWSRSGKSFSQIETYRIGPITLLKNILSSEGNQNNSGVSKETILFNSKIKIKAKFVLKAKPLINFYIKL
jgi:hypothetical protein